MALLYSWHTLSLVNITVFSQRKNHPPLTSLFLVSTPLSFMFKWFVLYFWHCFKIIYRVDNTISRFLLRSRNTVQTKHTAFSCQCGISRCPQHLRDLLGHLFPPLLFVCCLCMACLVLQCLPLSSHLLPSSVLLSPPPLILCIILCTPILSPSFRFPYLLSSTLLIYALCLSSILSSPFISSLSLSYLLVSSVLISLATLSLSFASLTPSPPLPHPHKPAQTLCLLYAMPVSPALFSHPLLS